MSRIEQHLVLGGVEEAWALKKSFTQSFNMVAVAVRLTGFRRELLPLLTRQ